IERDFEDAFLAAVRPGHTVYDLGANVGWFSLLAGRRVGAGGRVVAFEPDLQNAALAERNAARNGLANVTVVPAAVGDRDGWASFRQEASIKGRLDEGGGLPVPLVSLDGWIESGRDAPPDVVKIDVEGAELGVLRGMERTLRELSPTLFVELHG